MDIRKTDTYKTLFARFGLRLNIDQIAEFKGVDRRTVQNQIYRGRLEFAVYREGAQWYADTRAVAEYVESKYRESSGMSTDLQALLEEAADWIAADRDEIILMHTVHGDTATLEHEAIEIVAEANDLIERLQAAAQAT